MLKIDTSGNYASIQVGGSVDELIKELTMIVASVAKGLSKQSLTGALLLLTSVGEMIADEDFIGMVLFDEHFDKGVVSVTKDDNETDEQAEMRATLEAMSRFSKMRPIKVDENYNVIDMEDKE